MAIQLGERLAVARLAYSQAFGVLRRHVSVLTPAVLYTAGLALVAAIVYYFPRDPVYKFFYGPVTKLPYFTTLAVREGLVHPSQFFRYPNNLLITRVLFRWAETAFSATLGIVLMGAMARMVMRATEGVETAFGSSLWLAVRRWPGLFVLWAIPYAAGKGVNQLVSALLERGRETVDFAVYVFGMPVVRFIALALAGIVLVQVAVQALILYALPSVMVEGRRVWWALGRSFSVMRQMPLPSVVIVLVAVLFLLPGGVLATFYRFIPAFEDVPEVPFYSICLDVAGNFFFNVLLYVPATILLILKRDTEEQEVG